MNYCIDANIIEINDGPYFRVRLSAVPSIGQKIELFSDVDLKAGYPPKKSYEVLDVIHHVSDIKSHDDKTEVGGHFVEIQVRTI